MLDPPDMVSVFITGLLSGWVLVFVLAFVILGALLLSVAWIMLPLYLWWRRDIRVEETAIPTRTFYAGDDWRGKSIKQLKEEAGGDD